MKKWLVRGGAGVGTLVAVMVGGVGVRFYGMLPLSRPATDVKAPSTPEAIERGRYLVHHVAGCVGCHSPIDDSKPGDAYVEGKAGAGRDFGDFGAAPFRLRAHNLTSDPQTGLGNWTDGEILRAMREGIGKDGHVLFPQMPYKTYRETLSDDDALAVIAYLRTLPPIVNDPGKTEVKFPVSMFIRGEPRPVTSSPPPSPPPSDKLARGMWLLRTASCNDCHDGYNERMEKLPGREMAGGTPFPVPGKGTVVVPNITSDPATGIGSYSDAELRRVLDEGKNKAGRTLYMMPWSYYKGMTDEDKDALIAALRTVPPVVNAVPPNTF